MRITWEQVTDSSIGISWEPVQKADCYRVYWADSAGSTVRYRLMAETKACRYTLEKATHVPPLSPGGGGEERRRNGVQ